MLGLILAWKLFNFNQGLKLCNFYEQILFHIFIILVLKVNQNCTRFYTQFRNWRFEKLSDFIAETISKTVAQKFNCIHRVCNQCTEMENSRTEIRTKASTRITDSFFTPFLMPGASQDTVFHLNSTLPSFCLACSAHSMLFAQFTGGISSSKQSLSQTFHVSATVGLLPTVATKILFLNTEQHPKHFLQTYSAPQNSITKG